MLIQVALHRGTRNGRYARVIDVADFLGEQDLGNATNALAQLAQDSPRYKETAESAAFKEWLRERDRGGSKKCG